MENSGGRSEIDIDDENDSARTIAASFFYLFSAYPLLLVSRIHSGNLFGATLLTKHVHIELLKSATEKLPCVGSCRGRAEVSRNDPPWAALKEVVEQTASTSRIPD